jgi:hypothetical protein
MIIVNRTGDWISGSVNGKSFSVSYSDERFQVLSGAAKKAEEVETMEEFQGIINTIQPFLEEDFKTLVETATPYLYVNRATKEYFLKYNGTVSNKAIPQPLVDKILTSIEKGIDINPLVKLWARFLRNPNYSTRLAERFVEYIMQPYTNLTLAQELFDKGMSKTVAEEAATTTQVAITVEGLLVCYKVSREILIRYELNEDEEVITKSRYKKVVDPDSGEVSFEEPAFVEDRLFEPALMGQTGDAFMCEDLQGNGKLGHFIKVGHVHYLESWDQVDCSEMACCKGLHVGGLKYIHGYQSSGTVTHNILVDPMDIGTIVGMGCGDDGAMRVRRYMVYSTMNGVNKNIYHHAKFAALTDADYALAVKEAVEKTIDTREELQAELNRQHALLS